MNAENKEKLDKFIEIFGNKAVWQVDTILIELVELIVIDELKKKKSKKSV